MAARLALGLIGAGRWGRNYIRTIAGLDDARLVSVASQNPETAALVGSETRVIPDWRALVSDPSVDAVIIASPADAHAEATVAAIEAGKPVLVEKPLTASVTDLEKIQAAARRRRAAVLVDHTHLFHAGFVELKKRVEEAGGARAVRASAGNFASVRADVSVLWDWAPHDVAMTLDLFKHAPLAVVDSRRLSSSVSDGLHLERIGVEMRAGRVEIRLGFSTMDAKHRWYAVDVDEATFVYRDQGVFLTRIPGKGAHVDAPGAPLVLEARPPLTVAVETFVEGVRSGKDFAESFSLGGDVVRHIDAAERALSGSGTSRIFRTD